MSDGGAARDAAAAEQDSPTAPLTSAAGVQSSRPTWRRIETESE
jgi:hypothetical protein